MNYVRRESFRERLLYRSSAVLNARTLVYIGEVPNKLGAEHATFLSLQFFVSAGLLSTIFIYTCESDRGATKCFVVYRFEKVDCLRQKCTVEGGERGLANHRLITSIPFSLSLSPLFAAPTHCDNAHAHIHSNNYIRTPTKCTTHPFYFEPSLMHRHVERFVN